MLLFAPQSRNIFSSTSHKGKRKMSTVNIHRAKLPSDSYCVSKFYDKRLMGWQQHPQIYYKLLEFHHSLKCMDFLICFP